MSGPNQKMDESQRMQHSLAPPSAGSVQPFILAGGRSSRFGADKALAEVDGVRQIDRLAAMLGDHFSLPAVLLCSESTAAVHPDRPVLVDSGGSRGPASGLATALEHLCLTCAAPWALLVPCDQFAWGRELTDALIKPWQPPADAIAISLLGRICPLPSLWHRRRAPFARSLAQSEHRSIARSLAADPLSQILVRDDLASCLGSFNTPDELKELQRRREAGGTMGGEASG